MNNTLEELRELPREVQEEAAKQVGGGFGTISVTVEYNNGKYDVCGATCIRKYYAPDHKVWFFDKKTIEQCEELKPILDAKEKEYQRWCENEGKNFDWEAFMQ
jgi:hypothetical protein